MIDLKEYRQNMESIIKIQRWQYQNLMQQKQKPNNIEKE